MSTPANFAGVYATVGINIDVESLDAAGAGSAGLFGRFSYGRYGLREGLPRLIDALGEVGVKATFYAPVDDLARHGEVIRTVMDAGHGIAVRGRIDRGAGPEQLTNALGEEREAMRRLTGQMPGGWRAVDGIVNRHTLPVLAQLGYAWDSSFCDDDLPYVVSSASGVRLVELPTFDYLSDAPFYAQRHTHARVAKAWREEADALYCARGYVHVTLHTRGDTGSSRLPRVDVVSDLLRWMKRKPGIVVLRADELARAWLDTGRPTEPFPEAPTPRI